MSKMAPREPLLPKVGDDWTKPKEREPLLPKRDAFVNTTRGTWQVPDVVRWTSVPPTEVGWYWWRVNNADDEPQIFSCDPPDIFIGNDARMATEMRGEWWPTPIEPPKG